MTMISRLLIITTSIRPSTTSMITVSLSLGTQPAALVADAGDQRVQRVLVAERGFDEVRQLHPEVKDVHALRHDQAQVQRQLQPAAGKDEVRQGCWRALEGGVGCSWGLARDIQGEAASGKL
jgi:hypothetical protein